MRKSEREMGRVIEVREERGKEGEESYQNSASMQIAGR